MSLTNIILQHPAGYLMSDSGTWRNDDGVLTKLAPKVFHSLKHRLAFSVRGYNDPAAGVVAEMDRFLTSSHVEPTAEELLAAMPMLFQIGLMRQGVTTAGPCSCEISILFWSERQGRTLGYCIRNRDQGGPSPLLAWEMQPVLALLGIGGAEGFGGFSAFNDPERFNIRRDGRRLVEAQRRVLVHEQGSFAAARHGPMVAGPVYLTRVDAEGVHHELLVRWDDAVGAPVDLSLPSIGPVAPEPVEPSALQIVAASW